MPDDRASRWFGSVETGEATGQAIAVVDELVRMLDRIRPTLLDRRHSSVTTAGHRTLGAELHVLLVHRTTPEAHIGIEVRADQAVVSWATVEERVHSSDGADERPWTTVVADRVAAVLCGEYLMELKYKGQRLVRARTLDIADPNSPRLVSETRMPIISWLPVPRARTDRAQISYGCTGHPSAGT